MKGKTWMLLVAGTLVALVLAVSWYAYDAYARQQPAGIVTASGRLEGRAVRVSAGAAGRIVRLAVREGDRVARGDLIAEIDRRDEEAAVAGARAAVAAAEAGAVAADRRVAALATRLELARTEAGRSARLFARDATSRQAMDRAAAEVESLESELRAAQAAATLARRQTDLARSQLAAADVHLSETRVVSPVTGVVSAELARSGETVGPGVPIVEILVADDMKLRVYLPLEQAERVAPGREARIYVAAAPDWFFPAAVERVAGQAEFTPKDVHMPDDRATLVFAVDLRIPNPDGVLKDGFPADAYIRWDPAAPWPEKRPW